MATVKQLKDDVYEIEDEKDIAETKPEAGDKPDDSKDTEPPADTSKELTVEIDDDDEHGDSDDDHSASESDEERAAIRERRKQERIERKEYRKQKEETQRREMAALRAEREQMALRLSILERKTTGSEIAQIDTAIEEAERVSHMLKDQIRIATEANDGAAMAEATDRFYQVRQRSTDLQRLKQAAISNTSQQNQPQQAALDPSLKRNAETWMAKNSWYNPQGTDADSRVALAIDNTLAEEGWDPRQPEFWEELTARLEKYMPHRFQQRNTSTQSRPRTVTGGSGRDSALGNSGTTQFKLSPERVQAMKDAGIWDDPDKRNAMIKKYSNYDKESKQ